MGAKSILRNVYQRTCSPRLKQLVRKAILAAQATVHRLRYPGNQRQCNYCGFSSQRFRPSGYDHPVLLEKKIVGGGRRPNSVCPNCHSNDRERLTKIVIERFAPCSDQSVVLVVAPERNLFGYLRDSVSAEVHASDLFPRFYDWADGIVAQDLTKMTYADASFDLVVCNHVLEHIPDDRVAMQEVLRVLKPGGFAILGVPYSESLETIEEDLTIDDPEEQIRRFGQRDHVRIYTSEGYIERLTGVGFESHFKPASTFKDDSQFSLNPQEAAMLFRKPLLGEIA